MISKRNQKIAALLISISAVIFLSSIFFVFSNTAGAAGTVKKAGIVKCGLNFQDPDLLKEGVDTSKPCEVCDILVLASSTINFLVSTIFPAIATLLFLFAGFLIIIGGAEPSQVQKGKEIFKTTVYGLLIIYSSWLVANSVLKSLAGDNDVSNSWNTIVCTNPAVSVQPPSQPAQKYSCVNNQCAPISGGDYTDSNCGGKCTAVPPPVSVGTCTGVTCKNSKGVEDKLICGPNTGANCFKSAVNNWNNQIAAGTAGLSICSGVDTVKLVKAIMSQESNGVPGKTSFNGSSYGIMQMQISTANNNKAGCTTDNIDANWLLSSDPAKIQASICIATKYLATVANDCGCNPRQIAAGYNGGSLGLGACNVSSNCGPVAAADGGQCSMCANETGFVRRWECLWDDNKHQVCNVNRSDGSFAQTRVYAPSVEYCYSQF